MKVIYIMAFKLGEENFAMNFYTLESLGTLVCKYRNQVDDMAVYRMTSLRKIELVKVGFMPTSDKTGCILLYDKYENLLESAEFTLPLGITPKSLMESN